MRSSTLVQDYNLSRGTLCLAVRGASNFAALLLLRPACAASRRSRFCPKPANRDFRHVGVGMDTLSALAATSSLRQLEQMPTKALDESHPIL